MFKLKYPKFWSNKNWIAYLLKPLSYIYILLGFLRRKFTKQIKLSQTVICVGNITVGGTGKTQVVAWLARVLNYKKIPFVIVTKAYRSNLTKAKIVDEKDFAQNVGDESIVLSQFGPVIATKKLQDSLELIKEINPKIVILDDGMQNPLLYKDLQILVFNSKQNVGNNQVLPSGPLRESINAGLKKTDIITIIGESHCSDFNLVNKIVTSKKPYFYASTKFDKDFDPLLKYIAFAGIGNPEKFYSLLKKYNLNIIESISFEDHYNYNDEDLSKLIDIAKKNNCRLITTEKDYVKIPSQYKAYIDCAKVVLEFEKETQIINLVYETILQKNNIYS